ncbi:hypothetical protein CryarDRAFT_3881 [Cryptosporangium arvum DSM 44712]|uniref:Uncharacterized protein n=1 Tax=Cryptosporangium arvum DSM 44712 TaxID=927661 RepID=A0A011AL55_9ACTN|nr:hypothetical protein CryarDRAFT_3881 [Cryptosporangium arvum DSM 44712]
MTRLADRLLSLIAPSTTASAAMQTQCFSCSTTRAKLCRRDCIQGVCEPWGCGSCGSC